MYVFSRRVLDSSIVTIPYLLRPNTFSLESLECNYYTHSVKPVEMSKDDALIKSIQHCHIRPISFSVFAVTFHGVNSSASEPTHLWLFGIFLDFRWSPVFLVLFMPNLICLVGGSSFALNEFYWIFLWSPIFLVLFMPNLICFVVGSSFALNEFYWIFDGHLYF